MKNRPFPTSMTRNIKSGMQIFREATLYGICFSRKGKWTDVILGGPYRERKM